MKKIRSLIFFVSLLLFVNIALSNPDYKWQKMSGKWETENSLVTQNQARTFPWNYYELINVNSIISRKDLDKYNTIHFDFKIFDRYESPAEFSVSFAVRSSHRKWFYHIYSVKLSGGFFGITKASLIHSDRKDKTKKYATKNNIFIKELVSDSCWLKYGKKYKGIIRFEKDKVSFFVDGEKFFTGKLPSEDHSGRIALSTKNAKVTIDKVQVKNGKEIVFEDDFDSNSILVRRLKGNIKRVPKK